MGISAAGWKDDSGLEESILSSNSNVDIGKRSMANNRIRRTLDLILVGCILLEAYIVEGLLIILSVSN